MLNLTNSPRKKRDPKWQNTLSMTTVGRGRENGIRPYPRGGAFAGNCVVWETKGRDGDKPWGRQELMGQSGSSGNEKCWHVWGQHCCTPGSDCVGAVAEFTLKQFLIAKSSFSEWLLLQAQEKTPNNHPKSHLQSGASAFSKCCQ